ncbi:MAG: AGE family epimerase/isomerase [Hyphomonadaceae bacterium]
MTEALRLRSAAETARAWLFDHALPLWWSAGYDRASDCFHERVGLDGSPAISPRRVRVQARQTIVYARAGQLGWNGPWREAVETGTRILTQRCIRPDGGTHHQLGPDGQPLDRRRDLYDLAFVVFALAEAGGALGRADLLAEAGRVSDWAHAAWSRPAGGFEEGEVTPTPPHRQNPHMHVFEALLALYQASGESKQLDRAGAIATLFAEKLFDGRRGALPEYFDEDWRPRKGDEGEICEPGHQFEWSWLLQRWNALGGGDLGEVAERLRLHGETYGVDAACGAVHDETTLDGQARVRTSRLWPHTERLKANVVRYERTGDLAACRAALQAFDVLMRYCDTPVRGLWRDRMQPDGSFQEEPAPASSFYHIMIALDELMRVAGGEDPAARRASGHAARAQR